MHPLSAKSATALLASCALALPATAHAQTAQPPQPVATPPADPVRPPDRTNPVDEPARPAGTRAPAHTSPRPDTGAASSAAQAGEVTDQQVRSFALALIEVDRIQQQYQPRLQAIGAAERPALAQEQNQRMTEVIAARGLDVPTFNAISLRAQQDPQLKARIRQELDTIEPAAPSR